METEQMIIWAAVAFSLALTLQSAYTAYIMLYTWDRPEAFARAKAPDEFLPPQLSFTVMLPARHEEEVIQDTIERVMRVNYPRQLMEAMVICEAGDTGTIAKANERIAELRSEGFTNARVVTFDDKPINKPHGLNVGFRTAHNQVITIFDAEDEIHPDILNIVNTVMLQDNVRVVQCGVQLMNYATNWYSTLNVLEYFFWFKSRLHYHAKIGMIPLGGNTVFFAREILETVGGWDEHNLTEDADLGIRISSMGEAVRVVYDDRYVTKEETPPTLGHFIKQRTRWCQGFLQTMRKGSWRELPGMEQKMLAIYTLGFPSAQALLGIYVPISLWMMFNVITPVPVALMLLLPGYLLMVHFTMSVVGLYEFTEAHGLVASNGTVIRMALGYLPYQWALSVAAIRAIIREMQGVNNWEKTAHIGAHRTDHSA
ncbi:MAG: glycosyltransferase [Chloroflexi bacterium]|nr:glycosyltransferase [Chloroflexota bacterium]